MPIYLATLGPKSLELTGAVADGWLGTSFIPEHSDVMLDPIRAGAEKAGRSFDDIDIQVSGQVLVSDDVDDLIADTTLAAEMIGFSTEVDFAAGVADVLDWMRSELSQPT